MNVRVLITLAVAASTLCGCAHVHPWERGNLADPTMDSERDPVGGLFAEHMWFSREAATGGKGIGGGGCGCN